MSDRDIEEGLLLHPVFIPGCVSEVWDVFYEEKKIASVVERPVSLPPILVEVEGEETRQCENREEATKVLVQLVKARMTTSMSSPSSASS